MACAILVFPSSGHARLGIDAEDLEGDLGNYFGAPDGEGVLVRNVFREFSRGQGRAEGGRRDHEHGRRANPQCQRTPSEDGDKEGREGREAGLAA